MELLILAAFAVLLGLGAWMARRAEGLPGEPWLVLAGAVLLLVLAWTSPDAGRGPRILLALGAAVGLFRAGSLLMKRRRSDPAT